MTIKKTPNAEHRTPNIELGRGICIRRWALGVQRSMFALLLFVLCSALHASEVTIATPPLTPFYSEAVSSTAIQVKAGNTVIYTYKVVNLNSVPIYVHLYNSLGAGVTVGTTTQTDVWPVPANGVLHIPKNGATHGIFATGLTIAATTAATSAGTTAPSTPLIVVIGYQ